MTGFSTITLVGNLTKDAEIIKIDNVAKTQIANFRMAVNSKFKDSQGMVQNDTVFIDVKAFGKVTDTIEKYFTKGRPVLIEGRLGQDEWQDKKTGEKRSKHYIKMTDFRFLSSNENGNNGSGNNGSTKSAEKSVSVNDKEEFDGLDF